MTTDGLKEKLEAFSARARRIAPACGNEEQTKVSLVNPFLEILGYDVRDPIVCRLEYSADIGQGREKVDYAIMRDDRPSILIEAKSASSDFSNALQAPPQLQRYFFAEDAEFAVLTNGVVWQWYRRGRDGRLVLTPFLIHDIRSPGACELPWLESVSAQHFDPRNARVQAEETSIASEILAWIEETRQQPSDDLLRFILRNRKLGSASARRLERMRRSFVATFEAYIDRETDRLLAAVRDQQREEPRPESAPEENAPPVRKKARTVDLGDGRDPLNPESRERAWRVRGGDWQREPDGRSLMLAVLRYLASIDSRGRYRFYDETVTATGGRMFLDIQEHPSKWRRVEPGMDKFVKVHRSYGDMAQLLAQACAQCRTSTGAPIRLGEDIEIVLELSPG